MCEVVSEEMGARRPPLPTAVVCPPGRRRRLRLAITASSSHLVRRKGLLKRRKGGKVHLSAKQTREKGVPVLQAGFLTLEKLSNIQQQPLFFQPKFNSEAATPLWKMSWVNFLRNSLTSAP